MGFISRVISKISRCFLDRFNSDFVVLFNNQLSFFRESADKCMRDMKSLDNDFSELRKTIRGMPSTFNVMRQDCGFLVADCQQCKKDIDILFCRLSEAKDLVSSLTFFLDAKSDDLNKIPSFIDWMFEKQDFKRDISKFRIDLADLFREVACIRSFCEKSYDHCDELIILTHKSIVSLCDSLEIDVPSFGYTSFYKGESSDALSHILDREESSISSIPINDNNSERKFPPSL